MSPAAAAYLEGGQDGRAEAKRKSVKPTTIRWTKEAILAGVRAFFEADNGTISQDFAAGLRAATRVQFTPKPVKAKRSAKR